MATWKLWTRGSWWGPGEAGSLMQRSLLVSRVSLSIIFITDHVLAHDRTRLLLPRHINFQRLILPLRQKQLILVVIEYILRTRHPRKLPLTDPLDADPRYQKAAILLLLCSCAVCMIDDILIKWHDVLPLLVLILSVPALPNRQLDRRLLPRLPQPHLLNQRCLVGSGGVLDHFVGFLLVF